MSKTSGLEIATQSFAQLIFWVAKVGVYLKIKINVYSNFSHPKNELCERLRCDFKSWCFWHVWRSFETLNLLEEVGGKIFLVKATFALIIQKNKNFQFSKFLPNWFSTNQNLLGDSDPTQVGQKNAQMLYLSNRWILSKLARNQFWQWFWDHFQ